MDLGMNTINVAKLHRELVAADIPVGGVSSDGQIDFLPKATEEHKAQAAKILAAHDPVDYDAQRWAEYPDIKRIVLALLDGGQELEQIKTAIQAVNKKYSV
jgi:hypothetical protein